MVWGPQPHWFAEGENPNFVLGVDLHPLPGDSALLTIRRDNGIIPRTWTMLIELGDTLTDFVGPTWVEDDLMATVAVAVDGANNVAMVVSPVGGLDRRLELRRFTPPFEFDDERIITTVRTRDTPRFTATPTGQFVALMGNPDGGMWRIELDGLEVRPTAVPYGALPTHVTLRYVSDGEVLVATDAGDGSTNEAVGRGVAGEESLFTPTGYFAERSLLLSQGIVLGPDRSWVILESRDRFDPRGALFAYPLSRELTPLCFGAPEAGE